MLRKLSCSLLMAISLFTSAYATTQSHFLLPNVTLDYFLLPNEPQEFINPLFWAVSATCTITAEEEVDSLFNAFLIYAEVMNKTASINDQILSKGDKTYISIYPGSDLLIKAGPSAKVELTNLARYTLKAHCVV